MLAKALRAHQQIIITNEPSDECTCEWPPREGQDFYDHLADVAEVVMEVALEREAINGYERGYDAGLEAGRELA